MVKQRLNSLFRPGGHLFYGWYVVGAAGGVQFLAAILWMQSYGAYVVLLQEEFGWSSALVAGAFALTRIESGILGPLQGWLADKYSYTFAFLITIVAQALATAFYSLLLPLVEKPKRVEMREE